MAAETAVRPDHAAILELVAPGSRVLDLGCGEGELLALLAERRGVRGQGVELDDEAIYRCVGRGLPVCHGDIDSGLPDYPDDAFDYVILNKSIQEAKHVTGVLRESLRVGRRAIVGFPNFAHWAGRWSLGVRGRAPMTPSLPYAWHDTPNRRFFSVRDFTDYCREEGIPVLDARFVGRGGARVRRLPNLRALDAIFLLGRR